MKSKKYQKTGEREYYKLLLSVMIWISFDENNMSWEKALKTEIVCNYFYLMLRWAMWDPSYTWATLVFYKMLIGIICTQRDIYIPNGFMGKENCEMLYPN